MTSRPLKSLIAGGVLSLALAGQAAAQSCLEAAEITSLHMEALRTELMVAALSCGTERDYNAFVDRFRTPLVNGETTLADLFDRLYGPQAAADQRDGFTTGLANRVAVRQSTERQAFCLRADRLFAAAEQVTPQRLGPFAERYSRLDRRSLRSCDAG
jgi:hypothetical protein